MMKKIIYKLNLITLIFLFLTTLNACKSEAIKDNPDEKIFQEFEKWKVNALKSGEFIEVCPTTEEFEKISDTAKYNKLSQALLFPKYYNISFGDINKDNKKDALFYFYADRSCLMNALQQTPSSLRNNRNIIVLIESTFDGYKVSDKIDVPKIQTKILEALNASRVTVSINNINGSNSVSGTCKIWSNENNGFQGMCCPDKLYLITIDTNEQKIFLHLNEIEEAVELELNY